MHCKLFSGAGALLIASVLFFSACHPNALNPTLSADDNGGYASDASRIEFADEDAISIADAAGATFNGALMRTSRTTYIGDCAVVGSDTSSGLVHTLSIYFGNTNCVCLDGRKRRGYINVAFTGHYSDSNTVHTITFDNYFIDDNQLSGSIQTWRIDTTVLGNWYYNIQVNTSMNVSQDPLNSKISTWVGNLERKWVTGFNSDVRDSEVFSISGGATLTRPNGDVFTMAIATPLQVALDWDFIESGVIDVSSVAGARRLDYGTGGRDKTANLYIGTNSYSLILVP